MNPTEILFLAGILAASVMLLYFLISAKPAGSWLLATGLCAAFTAYTGAAIANEGLMGFVTNQAANLLGVQVWYDLIIAVGVAIFLILPRARAAGMTPAPWLIAIGLTASIGLLAMIARMLWLEQRCTASQ